MSNNVKQRMDTRLSTPRRTERLNAMPFNLLPFGLAVVATVLFWLLDFRGDFLAALGMGFFCGFALYLPLRLGLASNRRTLLLLAALAFAAGFIRVKLFPYVSNDYEIAYQHWMESFREAGGLPGLALDIGDYNYPYRYFLALFAYLPANDLYLIKLLSVAFDLLLAYYAARICGVFTRSNAARAAAFFVTLFLPTVILNGAKWAQCDGIYSAFMFGAVLFALERKPVKSVACGALAFAFKLQAVFLLPIFAIFWIAKRVKFRHLLLFPVFYLAAMVPALIAGHSLYDLFFIYFNQTNMFSSYLTLNAPSIFMLIGDGISDTSAASSIATFAAFIYLTALFVHAFVMRSELIYDGERAMMRYALAMCVGIPFLLPSMHERYFYMAETLSVVCACSAVCGELLPVLIQLPPLFCYDAYFLGRYRVYPEIIGSLMLVCTVIVTAFALFRIPSLKLSLAARRDGAVTYIDDIDGINGSAVELVARGEPENVPEDIPEDTRDAADSSDSASDFTSDFTSDSTSDKGENL